jgi:diacylglycerol kinase
MMRKVRSLRRSFDFARRGITLSWKEEESFKQQVYLASSVLLALLLIRPGWLWSGLFLVLIAIVLATELLNTSIERLLDRLHRGQHPLIGNSKDCAAGAVFILDVTIGILFVFLLIDLLMF